MKIVVVGTGYVGLVTGACLSEVGIEVICVDVNIEKIENLQNSNWIGVHKDFIGVIHFY